MNAELVPVYCLAIVGAILPFIFSARWVRLLCIVALLLCSARAAAHIYMSTHIVFYRFKVEDKPRNESSHDASHYAWYVGFQALPILGLTTIGLAALAVSSTRKR